MEGLRYRGGRMISEGYLRRHMHTYNVDREVAILDVAQEYILEFLRQKGFFDGGLVFKGGTALRKFVFGADGRFSTDLDFGLVDDDPGYIDLVFDELDGAEFLGVKVELDKRDTAAARLRIDTTIGGSDEPAAVSVRAQVPWLPPVIMKPQSFPFLDSGLNGEFERPSLPILDPREIVAEKIAAFWRRRKARDLYDLEHLGKVLQSSFDGPPIAALAALKIYFDVVDEGLGRPPTEIEQVFQCAIKEVEGVNDLGHFGAKSADPTGLLTSCTQRYGALCRIEDELKRMVSTCSPRDRYQALKLKETLIEGLASST